MTLSGMACGRRQLWTLLWCVMPVGLCLALCLRRRSGRLQLMQPWPATRLQLVGPGTMCRLVWRQLRWTCCVGWLVTGLPASVSWMRAVRLPWRHCLWVLMGSGMSLMCGLWRVSTTGMWLPWIGGTLVRLTAPWVRCRLPAVPCTLRATLTCPALRLVGTLHCVMQGRCMTCVCGRLCRRCE